MNFLFPSVFAKKCFLYFVIFLSILQGITNSTNGPRLNVLDLMGEELMRQKVGTSVRSPVLRVR